MKAWKMRHTYHAIRHKYPNLPRIIDRVGAILLTLFLVVIGLMAQFQKSAPEPTNTASITLPDHPFVAELCPEVMFEEEPTPPLVHTEQTPGVEESLELLSNEPAHQESTAEEPVEEEINIEEPEPEPEESASVIEEEITYRYDFIDADEYELFVRCVEAEITGTDPAPGCTEEEAYLAKLQVAQVILNRVESPEFPNTVYEVITQPGAFSPLLDGRFWDVEICQLTREACWEASKADTPDMTQGCEFFTAHADFCQWGELIFTNESVDTSFFRINNT